MECIDFILDIVSTIAGVLFAEFIWHYKRNSLKKWKRCPRCRKRICKPIPYEEMKKYSECPKCGQKLYINWKGKKKAHFCAFQL